MTDPTLLSTTLTTVDRVVLAASHHPPADGSVADGLAVVVAHGLAGSRRTRGMRQAIRLLSQTAGVVAFDFRGHGRSGGLSTVGDREVHDLAAAVAWARELGYTRVATVGFSMGAAVALRHAATARDVDAVVAVSGPAIWYYRGTPAMRWIHRMIETRSGRFLLRVASGTRITPHGWVEVPEPPVEAAARLSPIPLLVVHGTADALFPVWHAEELYRAAGEPRQLWIEPAGHGPDHLPPSLLSRIGQWLREYAISSGHPPAPQVTPDRPVPPE